MTQLTLAVDDPAGERDELQAPELATLAISGRLGIGRDLYRRDKVRVTVSDEDGELLATGIAAVTRVAFEEHEDKGREWTERAHRVRFA